MKFSEYYQMYLTLHKNKWNRRLHVLGQILTIAFVSCCLWFSYSSSIYYLVLLVFAPFVVYPFAWSGHFFLEKNKPAAFKNPLWAKASDWVMLKDIIVGKIKL